MSLPMVNHKSLCNHEGFCAAIAHISNLHFRPMNHEAQQGTGDCPSDKRLSSKQVNSSWFYHRLQALQKWRTESDLRRGLFCCCWRQGRIKPWLPLNLLYSRGWSWILHPSASTSQCLRLQPSTIIHILLILNHLESNISQQVLKKQNNIAIKCVPGPPDNVNAFTYPDWRLAATMHGNWKMRLLHNFKSNYISSFPHKIDVRVPLLSFNL